MEYDAMGAVADLANKYPKLKFVYAHGMGISRSGVPAADHAMMVEAQLARAPNLYVDMSWDVVAEKIIRQNDETGLWAGPNGTGVMNGKYADRFIFGSDTVTPRTMEGYNETLEMYLNSSLVRNLQSPDLFIRGNADRIYGPAIESISDYRLRNRDALIARPLPDYLWDNVIPFRPR
jgi:predicted TIM-barrel fold metal-dependent hydrolase